MNSDLEERVQQILGHLRDDSQSQSIDDRTLLSELKTLIGTTDALELVSLLQKVDLSPLLDSWTGDKSKIVDIEPVAQLLSVLLDALPVEYLVSHFRGQLLQGLGSAIELQEVWLKCLLRCLGDPTASQNLVNDEISAKYPILQLVATLLGHESSTLAKYCHFILMKVAQNSNCQEVIFSDELTQKLMAIKETNDVVKLRVYDLVVSVSALSVVSLNRVEQRGYLSLLLEDAFQEDTLSALNCLQLICVLSSTRHGVEYVHGTGALNTVADKICCEDTQQDVLMNLLLPGYFKLFGTIGHELPSLMKDDYGRVVTAVLRKFDESNPTLEIHALDMVGALGGRLEGKKILNSNPQFPEFLRKMGSLLVGNGGEVKLRVVTCLAHLLATNESDPNGEGTTVAEGWFRLLLPENKGTSTVLSLCRQPFLDVRLAALELLRILATHLWGHKELAANPAFIGYLLDRNSESEKLGKEAKNAIVRELVVSPFSGLSFDREVMGRLKSYYKEGPLYVEPEVAVAVEGGI